MARRHKKSSTLAKVIQRVRYHKAKRRRKGHGGGSRSNPGAATRFFDEMKDTGMELLPTMGAFGGSTLMVRLFERFMTRFEKRLGPLSRHAGLLAWLATLLTVYAATTYVKSLRRWRGPVLLGTSIAAIVHLLPKYVPVLGWLVGQPMALPAGNGVGTRLPATPSSEIAYGPAAGSYPQIAAQSVSGSDLTLLEDDSDGVSWGGAQRELRDAEDADLYSGVFSTK